MGEITSKDFLYSMGWLRGSKLANLNENGSFSNDINYI
jgi:hypothetical protein